MKLLSSIGISSVVLCMLGVLSPLNARTLISGNDSGSTATFKTAVGPHVFSSETGFSLTIGANLSVTDNEFAVAQVLRGKDFFTPLAPEKLKDGTDNPLFSAAISHLSVFEGSATTFPVAVKGGEVILRVFSQIEGAGTKSAEVQLLSSDLLQDADGLTADSIVTMKAHELQNFSNKLVTKDGETTLVGPQIFDDSFIFSAVRDNSGDTFGVDDSGISLAQIVTDTVTTEEPVQEEGDEVEGETKTVTKNITRVQLNNGGKAFAFNGETPAVRIAADADFSAGDNIVDIHVSKRLGRVYVAYQTTSGGGGGARSVVVGRIEEGELVFEKLVPDAAVTGNDQIIATGTGGTAITAYKVRTFTSSARLDYLVVAGGNGAATAVGNKVYALPLVNNLPGSSGQEQKNVIVSSTQGTLAKFDQTPQFVSITGKFGDEFFRDRIMPIPATTSGDLLTNSSQAAIVGAGDVPMAATEKITDINISNDSVFVTVAQDYNGATATPGMFESQAILDELGRITAWTPWKRVSGGDERMSAGALDQRGRTTGGFGPSFMTIQLDGSGFATIVRRSDWGFNNSDGILGGSTSGTGSDGFVQIVNNAFPKDQGGVQGFEDFGFGLTGTPISRNSIGLQVITGYQKVMIVQTGNIVATQTQPFTGDYSTAQASSTDDTFPTGATDVTRIATITGTNIGALGPITTAAIARDTANGTGNNWIVVASPKGVSILANDDGSGWTGVLSAFSTLSGSSFAFRNMSNRFPFIKKIWASDQYLWILTRTTLERVALTSAQVAAGTLTTTVVAQADQIEGSNTTFADVVISDQLALLGTTNGLFRTSDGLDARTVTTADSGNWTKIPFNESVGPIGKLAVLSPTILDENVGNGGQIYVMCLDDGYHITRGRRLAIRNSGSTVTSTAVQVVNDQLFSIGNITYLVDFGQSRNFYIPDGGIWFHGRSLDDRHPLNLYAIPPVAFWNRAFTTARAGGSTPIGFESGNGTLIKPIVRNTLLGSWVQPGDFGVRVSE